MTKQEIRQQVRQAKRQHTIAQLQAYSQSITHTLLEYIHEQGKDLCILLYHSLPDEVDTRDLIHTLHAEGYTVLLPTVVGDDLCLHLYEGDDTLHTSTSFGIQESLGPHFTDYASIKLAIIPGMAFTPTGARLGRGKGYYDRLLPHLHCPLIGIAFPFQMLPFLPQEPHDIPMNEVVSCPFS